MPCKVLPQPSAHPSAQESPNSFFKSFRPVLVVAQVCGLIPLSGIFGTHPNQLRFKWKSVRHIYPFAIFVTALFNDFIFTKQNLITGIKLDNFGSTMFYSVVLVNVLFFINVAKQMQDICFEFQKVDDIVGYPSAIGFRIKAFVGTFVVLATFEFGFLMVLNFLTAKNIADKEEVGFWEAYFRFRHRTEGEYIPYSLFCALYLLFMNIIHTLNWNLLDFFLISFSLEISCRLSLINQQLSGVGVESQSPLFWRRIGQNYNRFSLLIKKMDGIVANMVITSYVSNLYHLSLQLLRILKIHGDVYEMIYYYFSLFYLILRTLVVSLAAAEINEQSKKPKMFLYSVKYSCTEASRFLDQVINDDISLTGNKFFIISRKFVIQLIGTIITYEVFLLQSNALQYNHT